MSEKGLQKLSENEQRLPIGFEKLSDEEQIAIIKKLQEQDLELRKIANEKIIQSRIAEHDIAIVSDTVENLSAEKKFYSIKQNIETGSGKINIEIKGGDTKFIIPIMVVIASVILGVVAILLLR